MSIQTINEPTIIMTTVPPKTTMVTRNCAKMVLRQITPTRTNYWNQAKKIRQRRTGQQKVIQLPHSQKEGAHKSWKDSKNNPPTSATRQTGTKITTYTTQKGQYIYTKSRIPENSMTITYGAIQNTKQQNHADTEKDDRVELRSVKNNKQKPAIQENDEPECASKKRIPRPKRLKPTYW